MPKIYRDVRDFMGRRKTDYQLIFGSPAGKRVLQDLARFARMRESIMYGNERLTTHYTGRQDVVQRIFDHLALNADELIDMYNPAIQGIATFGEER